MRQTALSAEPRLIYADSSALVKRVIEEPESAALECHLAEGHLLATSRIAVVEVSHATALANPSDEVRDEVDRLLGSCRLVAVSAQLLRRGAPACWTFTSDARRDPSRERLTDRA